MTYRLRNRYPLQFFRTTSQFEVDFTIDLQAAIEIKATDRIRKENFNGLKALQEENKFEAFYMVSQDKTEYAVDGIHCVFLETFLERLWSGSIISKRDMNIFSG